MILLIIFAAALVIHIILCGKALYYGAVIPALYTAAAIVTAVIYSESFRAADIPKMALPLAVLLIIWYVRRRFRKK